MDPHTVLKWACVDGDIVGLQGGEHTRASKEHETMTNMETDRIYLARTRLHVQHVFKI